MSSARRNIPFFFSVIISFSAFGQENFKKFELPNKHYLLRAYQLGDMLLVWTSDGKTLPTNSFSFFSQTGEKVSTEPFKQKGIVNTELVVPNSNNVIYYRESKNIGGNARILRVEKKWYDN